MRNLARLVGIFATTLGVTACAASTTSPGVRQVDTLYMFAGTGGAMAYSVEESGANLPEQYAPWRFRKEVLTNGPTFKAGTDKRALEEVKDRGYSVAVFTMTIEEATPEAE